MLKGLSHLAREARAWPFEQARALLARHLSLRLDDAERDLAATLIEAGKVEEAVATLPALARPVVFQCGYGASGLPHLGTFGEVARPTMVRNAFRALTDDAIPTKLIVFSDDMDGLRRIPPNLPHQDWLEEDRDKPVTSVRDPFGEARELRRPQQRPRPRLLRPVRLRLRVHLLHRLLSVGADGRDAARPSSSGSTPCRRSCCRRSGRSGAPPTRRSCRSARPPAGCSMCRRSSATSTAARSSSRTRTAAWSRRR